MNLHVATFVLLAAALPSLPGGCGGGGIKLNVDQCKTFSSQQFKGQSSSAAVTFKKDFAVNTGELAQALASKGATDVTVHLNSVTFTPASGVTDFNFVDSADLKASSASVAEAALTSYTKPSSGTVNPLVLDGAGADLTPFLKDPSLNVSADLTGVPPSQDWTADVQVCFKVGGTVSTGSASGAADGGK